MNQMRSSRSGAVLVATMLIVLTACNGGSAAPAPSHAVVVRTAETAYRIPPAGSSLTIEAAVSNGMNETLLLDGIGRDFLRLEKRVGVLWLLAYSPINILPLVPDIELQAGGTRQLTFGLYVAAGPNSAPRFEFPIPGVYRAVFGFRVASGNWFEVYSNQFELRVGD